MRLLPRVAFIVITTAACMSAGGQAANDPAVLWQGATLYRDAWGTPHIYGDDLRAMAFAFGQAQAEDHLEAMLLAYRVATGRAAAVLGESYEESDVFALRVGHGRLAAQALSQADQATRDLCEGFAIGVNTWLVDHPEAAPPWAEGVHPRDVLALWHAFLMSFADLDLPGAWRPAPAMETANAWALAPNRTDTGRAMLVMNPQEYHASPFRWYEAHLSVGALDVAGATLFGLPVILMGHNGFLAWTFTPNQVDFADVFREQLSVSRPNPADPRLPDLTEEAALLLRYYANAEAYHVRTATGLEERYTPALLGPRGPVLEHEGELYSWRVGGFGEFGGLRQLLEMGRSRSRDAFQSAFQAWQIPCFNLLYADRTGSTFLLYNGKVGHKPASRVPSNQVGAEARPVDWKSPLPAVFDDTAWRRLAPIASLPYIADPASGFLQACGSAPWHATRDSGLRAGDWPFWFVGEGDPHRSRRVRQLLRTGRRSLGDMQAMVFDAVVPAAVANVPRLLRAVEELRARPGAAHPDLASAADMLAAWNYVAAPESTGMTLYNAWWRAFQARTSESLPNDGARYDALAGDAPGIWEEAALALDDAVRGLRNESDNLAIPWGTVHRVRRGERVEPMPGAPVGDPIWLNGMDDEGWVNYGSGFAMAVALGETPEALSVSPFGASENPGSPHFDDQLTLMLERRMKRTRFSGEDVRRFAVQATGAHPELYPVGIRGVVAFTADVPITVRLRTVAEAPAGLPAGDAAFTPFVAPQWTPQEVPVRIRLAFMVPEALCPAGEQSQIRLAAYTPGDGWTALAGQSFDPRTRIHAAATETNAVFAVLGPAALLSTPVDAEAREEPEEEAAPAAMPPLLPPVPEAPID